MADVATVEGDSTVSGPSKRARVKSQRALESEQTDRLLARARAQERHLDPASSSAAPSTSSTSHQPPRSRAKGRGGAKKKSVVEYCICKTDGEEGTPMIECGICNDWFHFFCIHLSDSEAEKIHEFVCSNCEVSSGEKTTHIYDVSLYTSPSPAPVANGLIPAPKAIKRKLNVSKPSPPIKRITNGQKAGQTRKSIDPSSSASSSSSDSGSEADAGNTSESSNASGRSSASKVKTKRPRLAPKRPSVVQAASQKPASRKVSTTQLHPARAHVIKRMTEVMQAFFGDSLEIDKVGMYASELEQGLWEDRKELVNGKEAPGAKYKTQFNLLASSLSRPIREDLRQSILVQSLSARQVAQLTSVDLASVERIKELEAAKHAVLAQTVKSKDDGPTAIRLGRDGLERAEDNREKEMKAIQVAEEKARDREERRQSLADSPKVGVASTTGIPESPGLQTKDDETKHAIPAESPRTGSTPVMGSPVVSAPSKESPFRPKVSIASAWGTSGGAGTRDDEAGLVTDQNQIDLSDMDFGNVEEVEFDVEDVEKPEVQAKPVVWSGVFSNPVFTTPGPVKTVVQLVSSSSTPLDWIVLLPHPTMTMTGRLPVEKCLSFLSTSRLSPNRELMAVLLSCDPTASEDEKKWWNDIAADYITRGRHGVYKPYGAMASSPELYLIPLRPGDNPPEVTELIDGFRIPANRSDAVYAGVFVTVRGSAPAQVPTYTPAPAPTPIPAASTPAPVRSSVAPMPIALPNEHLAKLMASLPPSILAQSAGQSPLTGGQSPVVNVSTATAAMGGYAPPQGYYPPQSGPGYQPQGGYEAYPAYGGYPQQSTGYYDQPHQPGPPYGHDERGGYNDRGGHDDRRGHRDRGPMQPPRGNSWDRGGSHGQGQGHTGRGGRNDGRFEGRERDSGWGNRSGGGYGR